MSFLGTALAFNLPRGGAGEQDIRDYLSGFEGVEQIVSFSVPDGSWVYGIQGVSPEYALGFIGLVSLTVILMPYLPRLKISREHHQGIVALVLIGAVLWQGSIAGGFPWRGIDGALALSALVSALGFWFLRDSERTGTSLAVIAVTPLLLAI